jgi:hypothetical protein
MWRKREEGNEELEGLRERPRVNRKRRRTTRANN